MAFQENVRWGCQYLKPGSNNWPTLTSAISCWPKQITELTQIQGEGIYTPLLHGRAENLWQHLICQSIFFDHWLFTFLPYAKTPSLSLKWSEVKSLSRVRLFATPWTVACQAPLSMGFSRQEYWSGLPFPSPGDLPDPGIEPGSLALEADALTSEPPGKPFSEVLPNSHLITISGARHHQEQA